MMIKERITLRRLIKDIAIVVGLVLIWRGIWHILDSVDYLFFNGKHLWTGIFGIIIGLLILYIPDKDLKEIEKL